MKNVKWMDVMIAAPSVLTFASFAGYQGVLVTSAGLAVTAVLLKWGGVLRKVERKQVVQAQVIVSRAH